MSRQNCYLYYLFIILICLISRNFGAPCSTATFSSPVFSTPSSNENTTISFNVNASTLNFVPCSSNSYIVFNANLTGFARGCIDVEIWLLGNNGDLNFEYQNITISECSIETNTTEGPGFIVAGGSVGMVNCPSYTLLLNSSWSVQGRGIAQFLSQGSLQPYNNTAIVNYEIQAYSSQITLDSKQSVIPTSSIVAYSITDGFNNQTSANLEITVDNYENYEWVAVGTTPCASDWPLHVFTTSSLIAITNATVGPVTYIILNQAEILGNTGTLQVSIGGKSSGGFEWWVIALIIGGGALFALILIIIVYHVAKRRTYAQIT